MDPPFYRWRVKGILGIIKILVDLIRSDRVIQVSLGAYY